MAFSAAGIDQASANCVVNGAIVSCSGAANPISPSYASSINYVTLAADTSATLGVSLGEGGTALSLTGNNVTVLNSGVISPSLLGSISILSSGLVVGNSNASTVSITNNNPGTIDGTSAAFTTNLASLTGLAMAVQNGAGGNTTIENDSTIGVTALVGTAVATGDMAAVAVYGGGTVDFTNTGTINGRVGFQAPSSGGNSFVNAGTIVGSVSLGAGATNTFTAMTGSSVTAGTGASSQSVSVIGQSISFAGAGIVDGGAGGNNSLDLKQNNVFVGQTAGSITSADYINFGHLVVDSGAWTLSGAATFGDAQLNGGTAIVDNAASLGTGTVTANGGTLQASTAGVNLANAVQLDTGGLTVSGSNALTLSGIIGGTGGLTIDGSAAVTLSGANGYGGGTALNAGGLVVGNATALGTGTLTVGDAATLESTATQTIGNTIALNAGLTAQGSNDLTLTGAISGNGGLTKEGSGVLTLSGANSYGGGTTLNAGGLVVGNASALGTGGLTVGGAATLDSTSAQTIGNNIVLNAGLTVQGTHDLTLDGSITGGGSLTKDGSATLTLNGANTYTGGTYIASGTLALGASASLASSGVVDVATGATFDLSAGGGLQTFGTLTGGGTVNLGSSALQVGNSFNGTFSGSIGGEGSVEKIGNGTETMTGANTYTGGTFINAGTLAIGAGGSLATTGGVTLGGAGTTFDISAAGAGITIGALSGTAGTVNLGGNTLEFGDATGQSFGGIITGTGSITKIGSGTMTLSGINSYSGGTVIGAGVLSVSADANLGGAAGGLAFTGGTLRITGTSFTSTTRAVSLGTGGGGFDIADAGNTFALGQTVSGTGSLSKLGDGTLTLSAANSYSGGTIVNAGTLLLSGSGTLGATSGSTTINTGGILDLGGTTQTQAAVNLAGGTLKNGSLNSAVSSSGGTVDSLGGGASLTTTAGTTTLTGTNSYTGGTVINGGTLALTGGTTLGAVSGATTINTGGILDLGGTTQTQATVNLAGGVVRNGVLSASVASNGGTVTDLGGSASLTAQSGVTILQGNLSYTGATVVNGGTLQVDGIITGTSSVDVNSGGILSGTGNIDPLTVSINNGGTFAPGDGTPGSSIIVTGNLVFASGSTYAVQLNPGRSSFASVTGTATLGGATLNATFANGSYIAKQYTILMAADGVSGTFGSIVNSNLPANFHDTLSYDATRVYLNLALDFTIPGGNLSANQQSVASGLTNYFNATGGIPAVFGALTSNGLTQVSGEAATGSQQVAFDAMTQFMGLMTDPFSSGRDTPAPQAMGYAATSTPTDAFAMFTKAPPKVYEARWNVWAAGFGGSRSADGNAALGSNSTTSSIYGAAVGADYWFSPATVAGFSMAGGGTNFSVANGGSGHSDLVQAGAFVRHSEGSAYVTAAAAYGWQSITTDRIVTAGITDRLHAAFNANTYSGRIETGNRWLLPTFGGIGVTPYAAVQVTAFDMPAYAETSINGVGTFGLSYAGKTVTDTRTELGLRSDKSFALSDALLTLRGRAAWAHDFSSDRSIGATFQTLPGASFTVNGAVAARDAALTSASVETSFANGFSLAATFDGEFSGTTRSYAGKGVVRYAW